MEALYIDVYRLLHLYATDISYTHTFQKPLVALARQRAVRNAHGSCATSVAEALQLHASVSHDADYVVASIVAETMHPPSCE